MYDDSEYGVNDEDTSFYYNFKTLQEDGEVDTYRGGESFNYAYYKNVKPGDIALNGQKVLCKYVESGTDSGDRTTILMNVVTA